MRRWLWNLLVSIDQTCGVLLSPIIFYSVSNPDETISSRVGKMLQNHGGTIPWYYPLAQVIHVGVELIDRGHFIRSIEPDRGGEEDAHL